MTPAQITEALSIAADFMAGESIEGFRSAPYVCPAKVATIGIGSTVYENGRRVTRLDPPITRARAVELCAHHLRTKCLPVILKCCPELDTPRRLAAVLSWAYNVGEHALPASGLRRAINARDWLEAGAQIRRWNKVGGEVLAGLVSRRALEARMLTDG
jgi:lysozyme